MMLDLSNLNARQRSVAEDFDHHILLTAPAGTGKTDTLAYRIANILTEHRAEPEEILCLTFTNKACQEMKDRILARTGEELGGDRVVVRTFHGFCYDVIKTESKRRSDLFTDFVIFDEADSRTLIRELLPDDFGVPSATIARLFAYMKERQAEWDVFTGDPAADVRTVLNRIYAERPDAFAALCVNDRYERQPRFFEGWKMRGARFLRSYDLRLQESHGLDFTDLIVRAKEFLRQEDVATRWAERYRYIHIDEAQDTSLLEYSILETMFGDSKILLAGDLFQTIYEWRGSHPEAVVQRFVQSKAPVRVVLSENYRATKTLLDASYGTLQHLFPQRVAAVYPDGFEAESDEPGELIEVKGASGFDEEAQWIYYRILHLPPTEYRRIAVLVRSNRYAKELSAHFEAIGRQSAGALPFLLIDDTRFFQRQEIKDALAFLRLLVNRHDVASLMRVLQRYVRGVGATTVRTIMSAEYRRAGVRMTDYLDLAARTSGDPFAPLLDALAAGNIVVFDTETTGLDPAQDEIVQIAGVRLAPDGSIAESFIHYLRPSIPVGRDAVRVHGLTDAFLQENGEKPKDVLQAFCNFAKGSVLVGHNVAYDLQMLSCELARLELDPIDDAGSFDTLDIFRRFHPNLPNHKLEYLGKIYEVEHASSHDAYDDICATAELLMYAIKRDIRPNTEARRACIAKYLPAFAPLAEKIAGLRQQVTALRPWQTLGEIVIQLGMKDYYTRTHEEQRVENLRELFRRAHELDDKALTPIDAVFQFLRYTTLSTTDLDALTKNQRIPILTIHQAKGAEFDYVFLAGCQKYTFPGYPAIKKGDLSEEKRLFYVAITRARKQLFLSWCQYYNQHYQEESAFIRALPSECVRRV